MNSAPPPDGAAPVRPGEELDAAALAAYLDERLPGGSGPLAVEQFPAGYSNLTYLVRRGDEEMVLRRPPFGNRVKTAHDMGREHRVLSRLAPHYPPAPRPLLYCEDEGVLGAPFYLMERRRGVILRRQPPPGLAWDRVLDEAAAHRLSLALVDALAELHRVDYEAAGLGDLGRPEGYVERQVGGWSERYRRARTHDHRALEEVVAWLAAHQPAESGAALVHNDFKYDNLLLDAAELARGRVRITAVLDWEMATVGDPLMDLGTTLGYWVEAADPEPLKALAMGPTDLPGSLGRRELAERYAEAAGRGLDHLLFYYVFGLFKIAVIAQQIYARHARGHTRDPRFAHLDRMVALLGRRAAAALDAGTI